MKVRSTMIAVSLALMSVFPLAGPAQATHNCGFDPCVGHVEDVCYVPLVKKYFPQLCV